MSGFTKLTPCAGCGEPVPYEVGQRYGSDERRDGCYGEHLRTPLGSCFRRTHRERSCVEASRAAVQGRPFVPGPTREARALAR